MITVYCVQIKIVANATTEMIIKINAIVTSDLLLITLFYLHDLKTNKAANTQVHSTIIKA